MGIREWGFLGYAGDPVRYADLMNGTIFRGEQVVRPEYLTPVPRKKSLFIDTDKIHKTKNSERSTESPLKIFERERDKLMLHDEPYRRFYLACEAQSYSDYIMPLRNFTYDGVEYSDQVKQLRKSRSMHNRTDKRNRRADVSRPLIPVYHQVFYLGEKRWISKHSLQDMMDIPADMVKYRHLLSDYHINFVDIHEQNPELFRTEWKDVFRLMNHSRKKQELKKYVEENMAELKKLSIETRRFLALLLGQYEILDNGEVEVEDMCEAWDGAMMMYKEEALRKGLRRGRRQGRRQGRNEGRQKALRKTALNMYQRGYSAEDTAGILEEPVETVEAWFQEFSA